jgi:hypothetical protein
MRTQTGAFSRAIEDAELEIARARQQNWTLPDGRSADALLELLRSQLRGMRKRRDIEANDIEAEVIRLIRWTADWIPNIDDPLLAALGRLADSLKARQ